MGKRKKPQKKSGNQDTATKAIVLITAITNLIIAIITLVTLIMQLR